MKKRIPTKKKFKKESKNHKNKRERKKSQREKKREKREEKRRKEVIIKRVKIKRTKPFSPLLYTNLSLTLRKRRRRRRREIEKITYIHPIINKKIKNEFLEFFCVSYRIKH